MKNIFLFCFVSFCFVSCSHGQRCKDLDFQKMETTIKAIENLYVDTINSDRLIEDAITSLLQKLDPYSDYMTPKEVKEMDEFLEGNFEGIGIQFGMLTDTLYVIQVTPGGPSEKAGIMAGDRVVAVNNIPIAGAGMKDTDIIRLLRGPKGTVANLKIIRGDFNPIVFKVVRDKIPVYSLDASYMIDKETGYIKLNCFGATTYNEFETALKELQTKGLKNLILDLQDNGGGYLQASIDIANEFLRENDLIVYTEGIHQKREDTYATAKGSFMNGKVIVLINEFTASASEIVSGALQDWDRAIIVGGKSFGKGLIQCPIPLPDGSMIKLTTARYHTPTGRSIQKHYDNGNGERHEKDLTDCYNRVETAIADSIHFSDSLKYNTLINKRVIYGGNGITPDYFVPVDTGCYTDMYRSLIASGIINKFVISYIDKNRFFLQKKYKNIDVYKSRFNVSDIMLNDLLKMFEKENFEMKNDKRKSNLLTAGNMRRFGKSKALIKLQIKALIARDIWNTNEYYQVINDENNVFKKAVEIIENNALYNKLIGK